MATSIIERFWANVSKGEGCWEWTAATRGIGYGVLRVAGKPQAAHRISWELAHGPVPAGAWVLHRCDNPRCVRPDHLFIGSSQDNVDDKINKGRTPRWWPRNSGVCRRGHSLTSENAYFTRKYGTPCCRQCRRELRKRSTTLAGVR